MTITVDGERSRKRLPVAKKALANIVDMGLPAKASLYEGFFYKVWQMGADLTGGRITAPFGIFVALSDETGVKQFVCDSAECAAAPIEQADRYLLGAAAMPGPGGTWLASGGEDDADAMILASPLVEVEVDPAAQWKAAQPVCIPFGGELVQVNACYQRTTPHIVHATQVTHCYSNGLNDEALPAITYLWNYSDDPSADPEAVQNSARRVPLLAAPGYFEYAHWKTGALFYNEAGTYPLVLSYEYHYAPAGVYGGAYVTADAFFGGATGNLLSKIGPAHGIAVRQHAAFYSRTANDIKGVCLLSLRAEACPDYTTLTNPCIDPADVDWWITLGFVSMAGSHQAVNMGVLGAQLYGLAADELSWVADLYAGEVTFNPLDPYGSDPSRILAKGVAGRLFGWPCESEYTNAPRDTVTFADGDGVVYSWLRSTDPDAVQNAEGAGYAGTRNGGFQFTPTGGIERAALSMPQAVLDDGTLRPRLLLMTATTFCCIADRADGEIAALYVGSPFGTWEAVTLPATMYAVRAIYPGDTAATAGFVGIGKSGTEYRIYLKLAGQPWAALSPIPVSAVNDTIASWDACVFGDDALAAASMQVRQHPVAVQARRPSLR